LIQIRGTLTAGHEHAKPVLKNRTTIRETAACQQRCVVGIPRCQRRGDEP
jgi:hypothetical protein